VAAIGTTVVRDAPYSLAGPMFLLQTANERDRWIAIFSIHGVGFLFSGTPMLRNPWMALTSPRFMRAPIAASRSLPS
jgi:hypothetical protein